MGFIDVQSHYSTKIFIAIGGVSLCQLTTYEHTKKSLTSIQVRLLHFRSLQRLNIPFGTNHTELCIKI